MADFGELVNDATMVILNDNENAQIMCECVCVCVQEALPSLNPRLTFSTATHLFELCL